MQRFALWLPVAVWLLVIFGLSSIPGDGPSRINVAGLDKLVHLTVYGVLGFLVARAAGIGPLWWRMAVALAVGIGVGVLDETYQRTVPGRDVDALDVVADALGASLGSTLVPLWRRWRRPVPPGGGSGPVG